VSPQLAPVLAVGPWSWRGARARALDGVATADDPQSGTSARRSTRRGDRGRAGQRPYVLDGGDAS
jgi:hypothetical protein